MKRDPNVRTCRVCGCTDDNYRQCIKRTMRPCTWVGPDLCSACAPTSTWLIRCTRGNDNIARVKIGRKTYRSSCTSGDQTAVARLAEKVAMDRDLGADCAAVERYHAISLRAGRGSLRLTFKAEGGAL